MDNQIRESILRIVLYANQGAKVNTPIVKRELEFIEQRLTTIIGDAESAVADSLLEGRTV